MQFESKFKKRRIQCRQVHGQWNDISVSSTQTNIFPDITEVEVNDLIVNRSYEFRGLFENKITGDTVQMNSKEVIKIEEGKI